MIQAAILILVAGSWASDETSKGQETPSPKPAAEAPSQAGKEIPFLDFDWFELHPRLGVALFTDDFHIDASPSFGLLARAPLPGLSPRSDEGGEYFGAFAEVTGLMAERTLEPEVDSPSGLVLLVSLGLDFTFVRNQSLLVMMHGGAQYGHYGGITDLTDGWAPMAGVSAGWYLGQGFTLTLSPEAVFGRGGDKIYLASLGLLVEF